MAGDDISMNGGGNGDEAATSKVKFMCSHGGKILPRPTDNQMKYVGGETRIVAVHRDITYSEIMKKLAVLFEGDIVLKYQLASEDLESLVSVRSDEDLKYMFEEYHRQERGGISKLRAFLFPANPQLVIDTYASPADPHALEQRYIDAINGIVRANNYTAAAKTAAATAALSPKRPIFTISSACSSPKSVSADHHMDMMSQDTMSVQSYQTGARGMNRMQKVHSSPSLCNLNNTSSIAGPHSGINMGNQQHQYQHRPHHHGRSPSLPPAPNLQTYNPPVPNNPPKMLVLPVSRVDMVAGRNSFSGYPTSRYHRGGVQHYDDSGF